MFGLLFVSPGGLVLAQTIGVGVALALHRRQKPVRLTFQRRAAAFTDARRGRRGVGITVGAPGRMARALGRRLRATLFADVIGGMLINVAIALSDGGLRLFDQVVGVGAALTVANTALGILAVMVYMEHPASVLLVAAPAATTYLAGKALTDLQRKHDDLLQLQRANRSRAAVPEA